MIVHIIRSKHCWIKVITSKPSIQPETKVNTMETEIPTASVRPSKMISGITMQTEPPIISRKPINVKAGTMHTYSPTVSTKTSNQPETIGTTRATQKPTSSFKPSKYTGIIQSETVTTMKTSPPTVSLIPFKAKAENTKNDLPPVSKNPNTTRKTELPTTSFKPCKNWVVMQTDTPTLSMEPSTKLLASSTYPSTDSLIPMNVPSVSLQPSSLDLLQTDSPTISRKPSNLLKASAEPKIIRQSSRPSIRITPSNGSNLANPAQTMTSLMPTVNLVIRFVQLIEHAYPS